eukprot:scaffold15030_cov36-Tisochrysis_lutea.AAC.2
MSRSAAALSAGALVERGRAFAPSRDTTGHATAHSGGRAGSKRRASCDIPLASRRPIPPSAWYTSNFQR